MTTDKVCGRGHSYARTTKSCPQCQAIWRSRNVEYTRSYNRNAKLKQTYGITDADRAKMIEAQGGLCPICSVPFSGAARSRLAPQVDHDHNTGKVRGILHGHCNRLLGLLETAEAPIQQLVANAFAYLSQDDDAERAA